MQGGGSASRHLNGSAQGQPAHGEGAHATGMQSGDGGGGSLPFDTQERLPSSSAVAQPTEQALRDKADGKAQQAGPDAGDTAARSTGLQRPPEQCQPPQHVGSSSSRAGHVLEPSQPSGKADGSRTEQVAQQCTEAKAVPKAVPHLKIPLSPRPPSAHELPSTRASQSESARSKARCHEPSPDEGWSPRQVHAPSLELSASWEGIYDLRMQGLVLIRRDALRPGRSWNMLSAFGLTEHWTCRRCRAPSLRAQTAKASWQPSAAMCPAQRVQEAQR